MVLRAAADDLRSARPLPSLTSASGARHRAFSTPRCQRLYHRWLLDGDTVFEQLSSKAITEAFARGTARIESQVLPLSYDHLSPLANLVRSSTRGSRRETHPPHGLNPLRPSR